MGLSHDCSVTYRLDSVKEGPFVVWEPLKSWFWDSSKKKILIKIFF